MIKVNETHESTFFVDTILKCYGWMFWISFLLPKKVPACFVRSSGILYRLMDTVKPDLLVIQNNAPSHKAIKTMREFGERGISPIEWPPYSPDVIPLERVWNLKNYIQVKYPDLNGGRQRSQDEICQIVKEVWDQTANERNLEELRDSMPRRIRVVLDAEGGPTGY